MTVGTATARQLLLCLRLHMGAVNCVVNKNGELIGENTDGKGFVSSLKQITDPNKKSCVIFGAGGAARAISVEMAIAGCSKITIINRSMDRGEQLVQLLNTKVKDSINRPQFMSLA